MDEKKKYKVTICCTVELEAENADVARDTAVELWKLGPKIITSVDCEESK